MTGIFIIRGMTLTVPAGGLTIRADGTANLDLHVHYDVVPVWLNIASKHVQEAEVCHEELLQVWKGDDEDKKALAVEAEFVAAMQAIVAVATALEALFTVLKPIALPPETLEKWKKRGPKRYLQVAEACRVAFQLKPKGTAAFQQNLEQAYVFRDRAIHPKGTVSPALLHPELNVGMEPRLVWFRARNASLLVKAISTNLIYLAFDGRPVNDAVQRYARYLQDRFRDRFPNDVPPPAQDRSEPE